MSAGLDAELLSAGAVLVDHDGSLLTVTLNRPDQLNAQTPATWRALAAVGEWLPETVRVVVLRGAGRSFSAGLDRAMFTAEGVPGQPSLSRLAALDDAALDAEIERFQSAFTWWAERPVVSIAAVQGVAVGAGFQLALACDLRVVADDARFAMRETSLGLVPDLAGTAPLVAAVGTGRAIEICATGRWVGAVEAAAIGLAQAIVPVDELGAATDDLVAGLLAAPEGALRETVQLLRDSPRRTPQEQRAAERAAQARRLRALVSGAG